MVAGTGKPTREERATLPDPEKRARVLLAQGMTRRDVAEQLAAETGITRNTAYRLRNKLWNPGRSRCPHTGGRHPDDARPLAPSGALTIMVGGTGAPDAPPCRTAS